MLQHLSFCCSPKDHAIIAIIEAIERTALHITECLLPAYSLPKFHISTFSARNTGLHSSKTLVNHNCVK